MVWPVIAIAAAGAIAQAYNNEQNGRANKKTLNELKAEFDRLVPPEYDISITDPPQLINQRLQEAPFDASNIKPEQYQVLQKYQPQTASFVREDAPELAAYSETGQEGVEAEKAALRDLLEVSKSGRISPALEAKLGLASRKAQGEAQSREKTILQDYARRGQLGSGVALAAQLQGNASAMDRLAEEGQNAAIEAERERLLALAQSGDLGGRIADRDMSNQRSNADVLNDFKRRTATNQMAYQQYLADTSNEAQRVNLSAAQQAADKNVASANDAARYNQQNYNTLAEKSRAQAAGERDYLNQVAKDTAGWQQTQRQYADDLKQQQFNNQLAKAQGKTGVTKSQIGLNNDRSEGIAGAIGGLQNSGMAAYDTYGKDGSDDEDDSEDMNLTSKPTPVAGPVANQSKDPYLETDEEKRRKKLYPWSS